MLNYEYTPEFRYKIMKINYKTGLKLILNINIWD